MNIDITPGSVFYLYEESGIKSFVLQQIQAGKDKHTHTATVLPIEWEFGQATKIKMVISTKPFGLKDNA